MDNLNKAVSIILQELQNLNFAPDDLRGHLGFDKNENIKLLDV